MLDLFETPAHLAINVQNVIRRHLRNPIRDGVRIIFTYISIANLQWQVCSRRPPRPGGQEAMAPSYDNKLQPLRL